MVHVCMSACCVCARRVCVFYVSAVYEHIYVCFMCTCVCILRLKEDRGIPALSLPALLT